MNLRILSTAEAEAAEAACWYDDQSPGLGDRFLGEYSAALMAIEQAPVRFGQLETDSRCNIPRCMLRGSPYALIFELLPEEVVVLAVAHTSRRPGYWRDSK